MTPAALASRRSSPAPSRASVSAREFGRESFRFTLLRDRRRLPALDINGYVEHANWTRDDAVRTGEVNFRRPLSGLQAAAVANGDLVLCEVDLHSDGRWRRLWQMKVATPSHQIADGVMSLALTAELKTLQDSKVAWNFHDRTARQITVEAAHRFHASVGKLPAAGHVITHLHRKSTSAVDIVTAAWKQERTATGRRFDVSISRGVLDVIELAAPASTLVLEDAVIDATLEETLTAMASAVVVTSTRTAGGRRHKIRVKVVNAARQRRYGYVVRSVNKPGLKSEAAAREYGKQWLARQARPRSDVQFTHPGLPFLDRGAVVRLRIAVAEFDWLVYVKSTEHELSAGSYEMTVTAGFKDPWADERKERAQRKREAAARRRKRATAAAATVLKPVKAARRS